MCEHPEAKIPRPVPPLLDAARAALTALDGQEHGKAAPELEDLRRAVRATMACHGRLCVACGMEVNLQRPGKPRAFHRERIYEPQRLLEHDWDEELRW